MEFYKTIYKNLWLQRIIILIVLIFVYWDGIWAGVPRSDQISYLHQVGGFKNYWDIILNTLSWNRVQNAGDSILFRPLLYIQLGTFYYAFGYNFIYWQLASLILHIIVVIGVHALLAHGYLRSTLYPLILSLLFGLSLLGSELVLWSHISGYILFSIFLVYTVFFLVLFFDSKLERFAWISLFFACLSQFTYELGVIFNFLILFVFIYRHYFYLPSRNNNIINNRKWIVLFSSSILLYPLFNYMDLVINGYQDILNEGYEFSLSSIFLAIYYSLYQIIYWIGGMIFPSFYDIQDTYGRAEFYGLFYKPIFSLINLFVIFLLTFCCASISKLSVFIFARNIKSYVFALGLFLLFCYSFIIAFGRSLPRGLFYTVTVNIYYSYIACLIFIVSVALISTIYTNRSKITGESSSKKFDHKNLIVYCCISTLCLLNAREVISLSKVYRYDYSSPRQELINIFSEWTSIRGKESSVYYLIDNSCQEKGNDYLLWFDNKQIRKGQGWYTKVTLIDALFPEKSFRLNHEKLQNKNVIIDEIKCS